jgi:hypothetical protein
MSDVDQATTGRGRHGMVTAFFRELIRKNRAFILTQVLGIRGLMELLMKTRNTGERWTPEEVRQIRGHLKHLARMLPVIVVFLLPGGSLLLPFLAAILDRRRQIRTPPAA